MKKRYSEEQILGFLKEAESGTFGAIGAGNHQVEPVLVAVSAQAGPEP